MQEPSCSYILPEESLTSMLLQKEKELQQLSKQRISQLQDQLSAKEKQLYDIESQARHLHDDLSYTTQLLHQRTSEVAELESNLASLSAELKTYSAKNSNLKSELSLLQDKLSHSEDYIRQLQGSKASEADVSSKLQDAFSQISKMKYEEQLYKEKLKEVESINQELMVINSQYREESSAKDLLIQKLSVEKELNDKERAELRNKICSEREKAERELALARSKFENEARLIKEFKENSCGQAEFAHKMQLEKLQNQIKSLLEDNKQSNGQMEFYQNCLLEKEKCLNKEIYDLRKEVTFKLQQIEELQAAGRSKDMEIDSIKGHVDHWKGLSQSRADELFKYKQLHIRSEEKAENYLKELEALKIAHFDEVQKLKKDVDSFLLEKRSKFTTESEENKKFALLKTENQKLNEMIYSKDKENSRLNYLIENLQRSKDKREASIDFNTVPTRDMKSDNFQHTRSTSRDHQTVRPNRSKLYQVKSTLDKKFYSLTGN